MPSAPGAPILAATETLYPQAPKRTFPFWPIAVLASLVIARATIYAIGLAFEPWSVAGNRVIPSWAQILQAAFFATQAVVLLYFGREDRRAFALGVFILDVACTLVEPFVRTTASPSLLLAFALHIRSDAFQGAMLWFFANEFPRPATAPKLAQAFRGLTATAFILGTGLMVLDGYAIAHSPSDAGGALLRFANLVRRDHPGFSDWYFAPQFLLLVPLLVMLPLKLRECGADDRRRFAWLLTGIGLGFAPLMVEVFLASLWPAYAELARPYLRLRGMVILSALTLVPTSAAYAALVQRTLDLRLVVRAAIQYIFARSVVRLLAAVPVGAMALVLFSNRDRSMASVIAGPQGMLLIALSIAGVAAAIGRRPLLHTLDMSFFREQVDARRTLIDLANLVRRASTVGELCEMTQASLVRALHPTAVAALVAGETAFYAQDADLKPLARASALAQLIAGGNAPLSADDRPGSLIARLSLGERLWLSESKAQLLVPLKGAAGQLLGILALGEKKSELEYGNEDRALLSAIGDACGLTLDRILAGELDVIRQASNQGANPAAGECVECGELRDPNDAVCVCGRPLQRAPVPLELDDRLRFVRRLGSGGMGVVYSAIDLRLRQPRAVKTLPRVEPAMVARLRREARTMAAANHPNIARMYGLEMWRGSPLLVMEFVDGGTLADLLQKGPLAVDRALLLGATLADGLGALHDAGTIHRDVKPSNIGFTGNGSPKLLDFGLAKLLPQSPTETSVPDAQGQSTDSVSFSTEPGGGIRGTPAYLSPEVLGGESPSPRDDLWSLSVTLLEACTGTNPFRSATVAATVSRVLTERDDARSANVARLSAETQELFAGLLGPVNGRPQSALVLASQLRAYTNAGG